LGVEISDYGLGSSRRARAENEKHPPLWRAFFIFNPGDDQSRTVARSQESGVRSQEEAAFLKLVADPGISILQSLNHAMIH